MNRGTYFLIYGGVITMKLKRLFQLGIKKNALMMGR